jgi:putative transcriptional regulator
MATKKKPGPRPPAKKESVADQAIATLTEFVEGLEAGRPIEELATVRTHRVAFPNPPVGASDVRAIRKALNVSQAVFAQLIGASAPTVRAWEQGQKKPSGVARRFLAELRSDPAYWMRRVVEVTGTGGTPAK